MAEFVQSGKSDVHIFSVVSGTNAVGRHNLCPSLGEEQRKDIVGEAIDNGITLIDTAFIYGPKRLEELIGKVVKEYPREKVQTATKGPHVIKDNGGVVQNNQPDCLKQQAEESSERLQMDYIDLYYIHLPDRYTPKDEVVVALQELKKEGKIKTIGVSNFTSDQLKEANKDGYADVIQLEYSLLHRENEEAMRYVTENDTTFVPYLPLVSGTLAGRHEENQTSNDHHATRRDFQPEVLNDNVRRVKELSSIAKTRNISIANIVPVFYLTRPSSDIVIPGVKRVGQVVENIEAVNIELTEEEIKKIDILSPIE